VLDASIHRLDGTMVRRLQNFDGLEVVIPRNDARTAKLNLSIYDPNVQSLFPLKRLLKVRFFDVLVFFGYIVAPVWKGEDATVEVNCIGPELKLIHHHFNAGDVAVVDGYSIQSGVDGFWRLLEAARIMGSQRRRGIPDVQIGEGQDLTPADLDAELTHHAKRGEEVWATMTAMAALAKAPDFAVEPVDANHDPTGSYAHAWPRNAPKPIAELNVPGFDPNQPDGSALDQGSRKEDRIIFNYGFGLDNLEDFTYQPDGDAMRNWAVVYPEGRTTSTWKNERSWRQYGIYDEWVQNDAKRTGDAVRDAIAKGVLYAYSYPPDYFQIEPAPEGSVRPSGARVEQTYRFYRDFIVGDYIRAVARKGYMDEDLVGRIEKVTLSQQDAQDTTKTLLDCAPENRPDTEMTTEVVHRRREPRSTRNP
jgi:hypothetical protein